MSPYELRIAEDGRLVMLRELAAQTDGRLNEIMLMRVLDAFGISRSREWVRTQMRALAELDAVRVTENGTVMIAQLTRAGRNHVERRSIIDGVSRPGDVD